MTIIPPSEDKKTRSIRVSKSILDKVDKIAAHRKESGNYIIEKLLEFALKEYDAQEGKPAK